MKEIRVWIGALGALVLVGCQSGQWQARQIAIQEGFSTPECVVADGSGKVYVSNILPINDVYWNDDGGGFVSRLDSQGEVESLHWLGSPTDSEIHSPKGMCILDGWL